MYRHTPLPVFASSAWTVWSSTDATNSLPSATTTLDSRPPSFTVQASANFTGTGVFVKRAGLPAVCSGADLPPVDPAAAAGATAENPFCFASG